MRITPNKRWTRLATLAVAGLLAAVTHTAVAQEAPLGEWVFSPNYTLGQNAANLPGNPPETPRTPSDTFGAVSPPMLFEGETPTDRVRGLLDPASLPGEALTIELWLLDHVNQPVSLLAMVRDQDSAGHPAWALGYRTGEAMLRLDAGGAPAELRVPLDRANRFKGYWTHLAATYDGARARLYVNGELEAESAAVAGPVAMPARPELEFAAYLGREPYMILPNLLHSARIHGRALDATGVRAAYEACALLVEEGRLHRDLFHFNAGPYLTGVTQNSASLVWETDRPATAVVSYGRGLPTDQSAAITEPGTIHKLALTGLDPNAPYYYQIQATDTSGASIDSGVLTFQTAIGADQAFSFAVIGDTESRPHINDRVSQLVWGERPHFMLNLGDLTDGGKEPHKFEWNHEYFVGITHLASRVPVFAVPGNGEGDLYWYNRYHLQPQSDGWYQFSYGNADFFMLDSNQDLGPGTPQWEWLDRECAKSTATWKFVAHHHAPYSSDENDYGDTWKGQTSEQGNSGPRAMVPLYEKHGVDMVFFGHLHTYERTWPVREGRVGEQGVVYVKAGGAGGNLEDFAPTRSWFTAKVYRGHHYCTADILGNRLVFRMYDLDGRLLDSCELVK